MCRRQQRHRNGTNQAHWSLHNVTTCHSWFGVLTVAQSFLVVLLFSRLEQRLCVVQNKDVCHDLTSQRLAAKSLLCVPEETLDLDL